MIVDAISSKKSAANQYDSTIENRDSFDQLVIDSWQIIAPFWPLDSLIAVNPLQGFEDLPIEDALVKSAAYFQQATLPKNMESINRQTIKWLQAYFDEGQATLSMPLRHLGLYAAWKQLAVYDKQLHKKCSKKIAWLKSLSKSPKQALIDCLLLLKIPKEDTSQFLKLLLSTMPGWASYIKYRTEWSESNHHNLNQVTQVEYLAVRAMTLYLLWPEGKQLVRWHQKVLREVQNSQSPLIQIEQSEENYRFALLERLAKQSVKERHIPSAQFVFCIDVRSEPFRRSLEATGDYETFGCAGFFGIPIQITDTITGNSYASCPVLLSPKHEVKESPCCLHNSHLSDRYGYERLTVIKRIYQSVKYTFATPFAMVESLGIVSGAWIALRTFAPNLASKIKKVTTGLIRKQITLEQSIEEISFEDQCAYAQSALKMIGLTCNFAPLVVFCGHGSSSTNNAYASSLDCGACGGRHGGSHARVLATILNRREIRQYLQMKDIVIPNTTLFIGAEHNTTTDQLKLYNTELVDGIEKLQQDLVRAQQTNSASRLQKMESLPHHFSAKDCTKQRSEDWAQLRPEWGLATNAAMIVAPRTLTRSLDLDGRCFLHSYDYRHDFDGKSLEGILTAPMVVAQWINSQYLFSALDNISYGGGSKVTKNITGKIGIMQGNASDLMTGLPLQSVYSSDMKCYHEPQRLMTVVYAPKSRLDLIIQKHSILQKLFGNGWVQLVCIDPDSRIIYFLQRELAWEVVS